MKSSKFIKWTAIIIISSVCLSVYVLFNGTPWDKAKQIAKMEAYLEKRYNTPFVLKNTNYNFLSETYQSDAYPKNHEELVFLLNRILIQKLGIQIRIQQNSGKVIYQRRSKQKSKNYFQNWINQPFNF